MLALLRQDGSVFLAIAHVEIWRNAALIGSQCNVLSLVKSVLRSDEVKKPDCISFRLSDGKSLSLHV